MIIQQVKIKHLNELVPLFDAYRVFYKKDSDKEAEKEFLSDRIRNQESVIYISRNEDGLATGFVQLYPLFSSTRMKRMWLLNDLFVDPDFRGQGYSKALIEQSKSLCRETDACGLMLETAKDNHIGNQLYPATDFELDQDHNFYFWEED